MEQNETSGSEADNSQIEVLKKHFPQCFDRHGKFISQNLNLMRNNVKMLFVVPMLNGFTL